MNLLQTIEQKFIKQMSTQTGLTDITSDIPAFKSGDTIIVHVNRTKVIKSQKKGAAPEIKHYIEQIKGVCIGRVNKGIGSSFTVRVFVRTASYVVRYCLYNVKVELVSRGVMRQAKPYYLLSRFGKKARITTLYDSKVA